MGGPPDPSFLVGIPNLPVSFPKLGGGRGAYMDPGAKYARYNPGPGSNY